MKLDICIAKKISGLQRIDPTVVDKVEQYFAALLETNRKINLVSRAGNVEHEIERQFMLSIAILSHLPRNDTFKWIDVGSGGGFPAVPIAIFRPQDQFTLVESTAKKAYFLERIAAVLSLANLHVTNARIEDLIDSSKRSLPMCNWLSVKAVGGWSKTLEWGQALLSLGGRVLTYLPNVPSATERSEAEEFGFELSDSIRIKPICPDITTKVIVLSKVR